MAWQVVSHVVDPLYPPDDQRLTNTHIVPSAGKKGGLLGMPQGLTVKERTSSGKKKCTELIFWSKNVKHSGDFGNLSFTWPQHMISILRPLLSNCRGTVPFATDSAVHQMLLNRRIVR